MKVPAGSSVADQSGARLRMLARIEDELRAGGSVFWVFPLVDESQHFDGMGSANQVCKSQTHLHLRFRTSLAPWRGPACLQHPDTRLSGMQTYAAMQGADSALLREHAMLIHGQMTGEQKHLVLKTFKEGRCRLLISTVVIEVGIDVPDATLMVVEHAERFGLLQLHQLRGRVGRSTKQSACVLVTAAQQAMERLQVLEVCPRAPRQRAPPPHRDARDARCAWCRALTTGRRWRWRTCACAARASSLASANPALRTRASARCSPRRTSPPTRRRC